MSDYRRCLTPGATYFFTVVTASRIPIFGDDAAVRMLGDVKRIVRATYSFETIAAIVLWDHLHCVWSLPENDARYAERWRSIKGAFTERWLAEGGIESAQSSAQVRRGERGVWQRRFWEHPIRDEIDLERHVDYIHYNPVKHGYVMRPGDWPWSTFHRHVRLGQYPPDWGRSMPTEPFPSPGE